MRSLLQIFFISVLILAAQAQQRSFSKFQTNASKAERETVLRNCFTVEMEKKLQEKYTNRLSEEQFETAFSKLIMDRQASRINGEVEVYQINTIIHVIHNGENIGSGANISNAQVISQLDVLNEDFRRIGAGANNHVNGADIQIEFLSATHDPNGQVLTVPGINRYNGNREWWGSAAVEQILKPQTIWDPNMYLNIWVVNFGGDLDDVLGYAQFPSLSNLDGLPDLEGLSSTDGVIIGHPYFGRVGNLQAPYDGGRTTTHEVGHWLGLRHIWGDGGCGVDDYCDDTPNSGQANYTCEVVDSCLGDELNDMIENYMDYTPDDCMNIFTQDQRDRIRTVIENSPRRKTLILPQCMNASIAQIGSNIANPSGWFQYTAANDQIVTISSVGSTSSNTYLSIYPTCESNPIITNDDAYGTNQSEASVYMESNESITILWRAFHSDASFNWSLTSTASSQGAACYQAISANLGTNQLPSGNFQTYWFSYTQQAENTSLEIDPNDHHFNVFSASCDELKLISQGNVPTTLTDVLNGEEIFIAFETGSESSSWELSTSLLSEGEGCQTATTAELGTNTSTSGPHWFTYTMAEYGIVTISSVGQAATTSAQIYDGCNGELISDNVAIGNQTEIKIDATLGDEIAIYWEAAGEISFSWELEVNPYGSGEICALPIAAATGVNTAPYAPFWYTYTMPQDGILKISSINLTSVDTNLTITNNCDGDVVAVNDDAGFDYQSEIILYDLNEGDEFLIYWSDTYSTEGFDWKLEVFNSTLGDDCDNPREALIGFNSTLPIAGDYFWHTFTMPVSDKKLVISSNSSEFVYILTNDCEDLLVYSSGYEKTTTADLVEGDEILIIWEMENEEAFEWELALLDFETGDICSDPLIASEGLNSSDAAPNWFTFTLPKKGNVKLSSRNSTIEDTDLYVFSGCGGTLLGSNDDINFDADNYQSEVSLNNRSAGETLYIYWAPTWSGASFDWNLTFTRSNAAPVISNQTFLIDELTVSGDIIGSVVATDSDNDALSFNLTTGNTDGAFSVDVASGELKLVDLDLLTADRNLTVSVTDQIVTRNATLIIDVTYYVLSSALQSNLIVYPNPAKNQFTIDPDETLKWTSGKLTDLNGRVVKQIEMDQKVVSCENLPNGLYFIQLDTNNGSVTKRIVIYQ